METVVAAAVLIASVALTYVCCLRPMRRGTDCCASRPDPDEVRRLRREVASLRNQAGED